MAVFLKRAVFAEVPESDIDDGHRFTTTASGLGFELSNRRESVAVVGPCESLSAMGTFPIVCFQGLQYASLRIGDLQA